MRRAIIHPGIAWTGFMGLVLAGCPLAGRSGEAVPVVWAHRPYVVKMAVTNHTDAARTVVKVSTSCGCLAAKAGGGDTSGRVPPGGILPFELTLTPTGMEGEVVKSATVTFDDGSIEEMTVRALVRTRLALSANDAAVGVVNGLAGLSMEYRLKGERAGVARITGVEVPSDSVFSVKVLEGGKGIAVCADSRIRRDGLLTATAEIITDDAEIPRIRFPMSVYVAGDLSITPGAILVGAQDGVCSRVATVRSRAEVKDFHILGAETKPRFWGDVAVERRPLNGWRITVAGIDPDNVRQFSKPPFLEVRTNLPGAETVVIPLRILDKGDKQ